MAVDSKNGLYQENIDRWQMMNDVCDGARAVKKATTKYLPYNFDCDSSTESNDRYCAFLSRAVFYPVTKDTLNNNVGLAFSEDPEFEPDGMDFLKSNADGAGTSIYQLNQKALGLLLKHGRGGFFVDYPKTENGATRADVEQRGIRPTVSLYDATQIINWRVTKYGGVFKTSLIVLFEKSLQVDPQDEFTDKEVKTYRVLRLDDNQKYNVQVYTDATGEMVAGEVFYPKRNGSDWDFIPFIPIGSQVNDFSIDEIPLEALAEINLAHYRNSASYEQAVHICGEVQPVLTELSEEWRDFLVENGIKLSSFDPLLLPAGGKFEFVSASIDMLAADAMKDKMEYMGSLGAKVTDATISAKTATQVDSEDIKAYSVLSLCVANLNEAAEYYLKWCAEYHGSGSNAKFAIKQDFAVGEISLDELKFYQSEVVAGRMSKQTLHQIISTGKKPEISYEDEQKRIEEDQNGVTLPV